MSASLSVPPGRVLTAVKGAAPISMAPPPWWPFVIKEQSLWAAGQGAERVALYRRETGLGCGDWCSIFINWILRQVGEEGTHSASARSWTQWGAALPFPRLGAVAVLSDGVMDDAVQPNNPWFHVTFFANVVSGGIQCLGGNQDRRVRFKSYYFTDQPCRINVYAVTYRWPGCGDLTSI